MTMRFPKQKKPKLNVKGQKIEKQVRNLLATLRDGRLLAMHPTIEDLIMRNCWNIRALIEAERDLEIAEDLQVTTKIVGHRAFQEIVKKVNKPLWKKEIKK